MVKKIELITSCIRNIVSTNRFFLAVILIAIFQGIWFTFSFKPFLFDELHHIQFIQFYSHAPSPFINTQQPVTDFLGQVTREPSYFYYFVMSIFLRVIEVFVNSSTIQIILLRLISIGLFVGSLIIFKALFKESKISDAISNTTLLIFVTMPVVGAMVGVVTYDTGVLPLIALLFLYTVKIVKSKKIDIKNIYMFYIVACVASVTKFTSLPVTAICAILIVIYLVMVHRTNLTGLLRDAQSQLKKWNTFVKVVAVAALIVATGLVIERPLQNIIVYKSISPSCLKTLPKDQAEMRCGKNYVYERDITFLEMKPKNFHPVDPISYTLSTWVRGMLFTANQQYPDKSPLSLMTCLFFIILVLGSGVILLGLRDVLRDNKIFITYLVITIGYVASVFWTNYQGYVRLGQPVAISARYLLPILPLFLCLLLVSLQKITSDNLRKFLPIFVVLYIVIATQGGGIITYLVSVNRSNYWQNETVININTATKSVLLKATKE